MKKMKGAAKRIFGGLQNRLSKLARFGQSKHEAKQVARQAYIKESREGDPLIIKHAPTSEYPNAAAVINVRTGQMLGHINKDFAASLLSSFGNGFALEGVIKDITGGTPDAPHLGCNIEITRCK